jgi:hypothetical protein
VFRYTLHSPDGGDLGEATYPSMVKVGELLFSVAVAPSASSPLCRSRRTTSRRWERLAIYSLPTDELKLWHVEGDAFTEVEWSAASPLHGRRCDQAALAAPDWVEFLEVSAEDPGEA